MRANWQKPGYATGLVLCKLTLPALDLDMDRRFSGNDPILEVRHFLDRHLPPAPAAHVNGVFTITAEFRATRGGVRRRVLSKWREGESIAGALERAAATWNALSKEHRPWKDLVGRFNSSLTRVKPIFNELLATRTTNEWLLELWWMALATRPGGLEPRFSPGPLLDRKIYERTLPPSTTFLRWMVQHPDRLTPLPAADYGAKPGGEASKKRAQLFGSDPVLREAAQRQALEAIETNGAKGSAQQWWAFEGFTHVDACFETEECLLVIEGKRTEAVSPSTRWFKSRNQLWRNVEVAGELAAGRQFGVIVGVESEEDGRKALDDATASRDSSYPHLTENQKAALDRHLLGFVTWSRIVSRFDLPLSVLKETR